MSSVLADLQQAFAVALTANKVTVLLPLIVVAIAQGLRADGFRDVLSMTTRGLLWFGLAVFLVGGLIGADRFTGQGWASHTNAAWDSFLQLHFLEAMGFWLMLFVAIALIFSVRSVVRR